MNDRRPQADALDRFFDRLAHDPQADRPDDLAYDTALFARDLAQALRVPSLNVAQRDRIWQAAQTHSHEEDHPLLATQRPARAGWNTRPLLALVAALIVVFAAILTALYSDVLPDGTGGGYGSGITPTPPPVTPAPQVPPVPITADNAATLSEVARLGRGAAHQVLWSPDGASLALVGTSGVWVYAANDLSQPPEWIDVPYLVAAHYLANGEIAALIADAAGNGTRFVNLSTGETIVAVPVLEDAQLILPTLSHDGRTLTASTFDGTVFVWDTASGEVVARLLVNTNTPALSLTFSPDDTWLAAGATDSTVRLWHAPSGNWATVDGQSPLTLVSALRSEADTPRLAFDAAGERLAVAIGDEVEIWEAATGDLLATLAHNGTVMSAAFSPDGALLVTTYAGAGTAPFSAVMVWDVQAAAPLVSYPLDWTAVATFSPDGSRIAVSNADGTVALFGYDAELPPLVEPLPEGIPSVMTATPMSSLDADAPDALFLDTLAMSSYPLVLREAVEPLEAGAVVRVLGFWYEDGTWWYTVLAMDETTQAVVREDQLGRASDQPTPTPVTDADVRPAPTVADDDQATQALAPVTADIVDRLVLIDMIGLGEVSTLAWSPDGGTLAAAGYVGVWLYDAARLDAAPHLLPSDVSLSAAAFTPDGTLYATTFDYALLRWDLANGTATVVAQGEANPYNPRLCPSLRYGFSA